MRKRRMGNQRAPRSGGVTQHSGGCLPDVGLVYHVDSAKYLAKKQDPRAAVSGLVPHSRAPSSRR